MVSVVVCVKVSVQIRDLFQNRIGPEVLQVIELAQFRYENVYHHIAVVHCNPVGLTGSLHNVGLAAFLYADCLAYGVLYGQGLVRCTSLAYNEITAYGILYAGKVHDRDTLSLTFLNTFYYTLNYAFSLFLFSHSVYGTVS